MATEIEPARRFLLACEGKVSRYKNSNASLSIVSATAAVEI